MEETACLWDMKFGLNDDLNEIFPNLTTEPIESEMTKKRLQEDNKQCNKSDLDSSSYEKKLEMTRKRLHDHYEQCNKARKTTRLMEYIDLPAIPQHGCGAPRKKKQLKREGNRMIKLRK
ncbi:hypothetical protein BVRB_3g050150 [Beta vulgaris subsp. vulgaris]|nr:hypothetical protein BVRB_3g050150 [Beta vulgaris subsp. vulgaris]